MRDARVLYGSALLAENRAQDAIAVLEKDRQPPRADLELALGQAYAAAGQPAKAAEILRNLYITMPLSAEASQADVELKKLASTTQLPPRGTERAQNARRSAGQRQAIQRCRGRVSRSAQRGESERSSRIPTGAGGRFAPLRSGQGRKEDSRCSGEHRRLTSTRNGFTTWERSRAAAATKMVSCATWVNCGRARPPACGCSRRCFRRAISICSSPTTTRRLMPIGSCSSAFPTPAALRTRTGRWPG